MWRLVVCTYFVRWNKYLYIYEDTFDFEQRYLEMIAHLRIYTTKDDVPILWKSLTFAPLGNFTESTLFLDPLYNNPKNSIFYKFCKRIIKNYLIRSEAQRNFWWNSAITIYKSYKMLALQLLQFLIANILKSDCRDWKQFVKTGKN